MRHISPDATNDINNHLAALIIIAPLVPNDNTTYSGAIIATA